MMRWLERQQEQEWRQEKQQEQHHFRYIGGESASSIARERKTKRVVQIYRIF